LVFVFVFFSEQDHLGVSSVAFRNVSAFQFSTTSQGFFVVDEWKELFAGNAVAFVLASRR
jgi:hypothetical protein